MLNRFCHSRLRDAKTSDSWESRSQDDQEIHALDLALERPLAVFFAGFGFNLPERTSSKI